MGLLAKITGYFASLAAQESSNKFEFEHDEDIDKWVERIDDADDSNGWSPDDIVAGYNRALKLCHDFERYCASCGPDGVAYYEINQLSHRKSIEHQLAQYLENDYEKDKAEYVAEMAQRKLLEKPRKDMTKRILKAVSAAGQDGILQKILLVGFSEEDKRLAQNCINALVKEGKIIKGKSGGSVLLTTK